MQSWDAGGPNSVAWLSPSGQGKRAGGRLAVPGKIGESPAPGLAATPAGGIWGWRGGVGWAGVGPPGTRPRPGHLLLSA